MNKAFRYPVHRQPQSSTKTPHTLSTPGSPRMPQVPISPLLTLFPIAAVSLAQQHTRGEVVEKSVHSVVGASRAGLVDVVARFP